MSREIVEMFHVIFVALFHKRGKQVYSAVEKETNSTNNHRVRRTQGREERVIKEDGGFMNEKKWWKI
jgi:hypothetical protein